MENMLITNSVECHAPPTNNGKHSQEQSTNVDSPIETTDPLNMHNNHASSTNEPKLKGLDKYIDFRNKVGNLFNFNWFKDDIVKSKCFPDGCFTPVVFWVYINSQYFPFHSHKLEPNTIMQEVRKPQGIIKTNEELNMELGQLQTHCQSIASSIVTPTIDDKIFHNSKEKSAFFNESLKNLTIDQLLNKYTSLLTEQEKVNSNGVDSLIKKWDSYYNPLPDDDKLPYIVRPQEIPLPIADEKTSKSLLSNLQLNFEEYINKLDPICLDFIYPSKLEDEFFSFIEKKSQKLSQLDQCKKIKNKIKCNTANHNISTRASTKEEEETKKYENAVHSSIGSLGPLPSSFQHLVCNYKNKFIHEEDIVCQICNDGDYEDTNLIIICSVNQ